jgi:hypothetical protein
MATYTRNSDAAVFAAIAWSGTFADVTAFLAANPPFLHPKVLEDNPNAIGIVEIPDGTLAVYGIDGTPTIAHLTDMILRAQTDHALTVVGAAAFAANYTLVP